MLLAAAGHRFALSPGAVGGITGPGWAARPARPARPELERMAMRTNPYRPIVALGLTAALLGCVGCPKTPDATPAPTPHAVATPAANPPTAAAGAAAAAKAQAPAGEPARAASAATATNQKPFADWPKPDGAILISGEQLGYLEPCGCTEGQLGGLLRRYELVERLAGRQGWGLARVDLGSLIKDPATARGGPEQTKIKYRVALKALAALKYDAVALSPEDLKVGVDEAVAQFLNELVPGDRLKVVAANVALKDIETRVVPSVRTTAGRVKVGITAVVDPERLQALKDPALDLLTVRPIAEALPPVLADLEKDTDTQVLLVQAAPEVARKLAEAYPGFDLVVATSATPDPPRDAEPLNGGKTLLISVGQKGKYVGLVGVYDDPAQPYRYHRVTLGTAFDGPAKPMKAVVEDEYRQALKDQGIVARFPRHDFVNGARGATFLGAEACKSCHLNTYAHWAGTKHARAYESLEKDPKPNTVFDAECVSCHTTGFEYNSGWVSAAATPRLKAAQCENCHGPASKHVENPDDPEPRAAMHLTPASADNSRLCLRCHDEDNSPHFNFDKYHDEIDHAGLDDYDDPRVHKGRIPRAARKGAN